MKRLILINTVILFCLVFIFPHNILASEPNEPNDTNGLPEDFPKITTHIYDSNAIGDGYIFLAVASHVEGVGYYLMMLNNDGTPFFYQKLEDNYAYDFKVQPNGLLTYAQFLQEHDYVGGGDVIHKVMDTNFEEIDSFEPGNGYIAEAHDFQILPNGHALLFGYYLTQMDLTELVNGGYPNAMVSGGVIQELDEFKNVVFQWRTWDYYNPEDIDWGRRSNQPVVSQFHLNTINLDDDGQILFATPGWVKKLNRQTGEIIWNLGGDENEFTFIGVDPEEAVSHFGGHAFHRLPNGNVLIYDNGNRQGTESSKVLEYKLDEPNKTAELIWQYEPDPGIYGWHRGNAQRLQNGNTFIGWGGSNGKPGPACTEVTPDGNVVFELFFEPPDVESYRAFRIPFPPEVPVKEVTQFELATGNSYDFIDDTTDTGISIKINERAGQGYNEVTVRREPFAPLYPEFPGTAPRVLPVRVIISQSDITEIDADISFDVNSFDFADPNLLTVYYRPYRDVGLFIPLPTAYNYITGKLKTNIYAQMGYNDDIGEFIFGYPDLEHIIYAPRLIEPAELTSVNHQLPVSFFWTPKGFASSYNLQVSKDPNFENLLIAEDYLLESRYTMEQADPNTIYFWRVSTLNDAGKSPWSQSSFDTISPFIEVTEPNDSRQWQAGLEYFIQWQDNLDEDVVIELYKGDTFIEEIKTVPSTNAYLWEVDLTLEAGNDYNIKIKSINNETLFDFSDYFEIVN